MPDSIDLSYIKKDLKHFLVNISSILLVIIFYAKYGFFGWPHLFTVIFIHYSILPLDDWLERTRPFPIYVLPLIAFTFYFYPVITILALVGDLIANLQALFKRKNFLLERLEGIGNVFVYVLPFTLPAGLNNFRLYLAATLFILFADSFHKIGHRETSNPQLMWATGLFFLSLVSIIFATPTVLFVALLITTVISLIPFRIIKKRSDSYIYSQVWFGLAGFIGFYYYLAVYG